MTLLAPSESAQEPRQYWLEPLPPKERAARSIRAGGARFTGFFVIARTNLRCGQPVHNRPEPGETVRETVRGRHKIVQSVAQRGHSMLEPEPVTGTNRRVSDE